MNADTPQAEHIRRNSSRRRKGMLLLAAVVLLGAIGYGAWWWIVGSRYMSTDNAYVQGNVVQVTPQSAGSVVAIHADETDMVRAGQPLVSFDDADARVALARAESQLGQTVREVRATYANNATLRAGIAVREAELKRARTDLAKAEGDLARRAGLVASGAVRGEEVQHIRDAIATARSAVTAAEAGVLAAREQLAANLVMTDATTVEDHPSVRHAAAQVREAMLALARTTVSSPVTGHVARRTVQIGQRVQAGAPMLSVVALDRVWVDANFKEPQLRDIRIGQPVTLTADVYGRKIVYEGRVHGLAAGTGATFALLPAQNATGNWIKVVQRVPVRIALDPKQLAEHPLRMGLSMHAKVDIRDLSGPALAAAPRSEPLASTPMFDDAAKGADERIARIVAENLGRAQR
jgi:membrane fusion protein (multidrug efflux system)